ncbi:hypothetical protein AA102526_1516 [Asaia lannensis NBRC 102526]|nr:hypothetical protein AA102526_1516 [Asaia lannensis NBRC 102526]
MQKQSGRANGMWRTICQNTPLRTLCSDAPLVRRSPGQILMCQQILQTGYATQTLRLDNTTPIGYDRRPTRNGEPSRFVLREAAPDKSCSQQDTDHFRQPNS